MVDNERYGKIMWRFAGDYSSMTLKLEVAQKRFIFCLKLDGRIQIKMGSLTVDF